MSIASLVAAAATIVYAYIAMYRESDAEKQLKASIAQATTVASAAAVTATTQPAGAPAAGLAEGTTPQAAYVGLGEYLKGLASFAESLSKLKQGVAALVLALAFVIFAGIAAGVQDKVETAGTTASAPEAAPTTTTTPPASK